MDPIFTVAALVLLLTVAVFGPLSGNPFSDSGASVERSGNRPALQASGDLVSFASDRQYWQANCSHGWTSNAACDAIVSRSQSCLASVESAYCSAYDSYLEQFRE